MSAFVLNRNYELQLPNNFVDVDREEMEYVDGGGFVGVTLHLSQSLFDKGTIVGAAFIGAVVAYYCKPIAAIGPIGAGSAAAIVSACTLAAAWAISHRESYIQKGVYIPFVSFNKHIYL